MAAPQKPPHTTSPSAPAYRAELVDAAHASFSDVCDYLDEVAGRPEANPLVVEYLVTWADSTCSSPTRRRASPRPLLERSVY